MNESIDWRKEFIKETFLLAKSNPAQWANFMAAFSGWAAQEIMAGLSTPTAEAQVTLGMGRRLKAMYNDFVNIEELAKKISS